jgi:hypothetical protein
MAEKSIKTHQVSARRTPRFNAEKSLYRSSLHYGLLGASAQAAGVVPQQVWTGCFGRCHRKCAGRPYPYDNLCYSQCVYEECE